MRHQFLSKPILYILLTAAFICCAWINYVPVIYYYTTASYLFRTNVACTDISSFDKVSQIKIRFDNLEPDSEKLVAINQAEKINFVKDFSRLYLTQCVEQQYFDLFLTGETTIEFYDNDNVHIGEYHLGRNYLVTSYYPEFAKWRLIDENEINEFFDELNIQRPENFRITKSEREGRKGQP